ncbi:hypothetical protein [Sphingobacterium siyangense]|uniref:HD domain-containing protein n=1 Tax=Sphingobacterium siyangense TaxID=459529 RepID=UPI002FD8F2DF
MSTIANVIYNLEIFKHFESSASEEGKHKEIAMVKENVEKCIPLLAIYYKAFPTYTLHNTQHIVNIVHLCDQLLGNDIKTLSSLEAALIILAAVYHDIGMVFNDDQISNIVDEEQFDQFLEGNYKAKLMFLENDRKINDNLAEWYCRWMHAQRVWEFLEDDELKWGKISLKTVLGNICESHNENVENLSDDSRFNSNFLGQADIRFCSILLRMADILDFDNTRSPKSVYEFLELSTPQNNLEAFSNIEWSKHLASDGFTIKNFEGKIELTFTAGPEHPEVERNIQEFLDIIENESTRCNNILSKCSERWRKYSISPHIDRSGIISQNYQKGNFRLSLAERQIISLLTGDDIYGSAFEFIRELLQNAIDSSRMREFHMEYLGHQGYKSEPIQITSWVDKEGFRWVRVDDYGMGINQYILKNHFLKKGSSFYKSDYFKLLQQEYFHKVGKNFTPISRFGIGLLSCFILGDKIEVSTKSIELPIVEQPAQAFRLLLDGLETDYILQIATENHVPNPYPSENGGPQRFRKEIGTSIAVRIKGDNDFWGFEKDIVVALNEYITCSPIPIFFNGKKLGADFTQTISKALSQNQIYKFTNEEIKQVEKDLKIELGSELGFEIIPLDLTHSSPIPNLKGQICFLRLIYNEESFSNKNISWEFNLPLNNNKTIVFKYSYTDQLRREKNLTSTIDITHQFKDSFSITQLNDIFHLSNNHNNDDIRGLLKLVHNGINVPNINRIRHFPAIVFNHIFSKNDLFYSHYDKKGYAVFGIIYLQDNLIPDFTISRNAIKGINFSIYSSLYFASMKLNEYVSEDFYLNYFDNAHNFFPLNDVLKDELVVKGYWDKISLIHTESGRVSIEELRNTFSGKPIRVGYPQHKPFLASLIASLLYKNFELRYTFHEEEKAYYLSIVNLKNIIQEVFEIGERRPLLFVEFDNDKLVCHGGYFNKNHKLIIWILRNETILFKTFKQYLIQILQFILQANAVAANNVLSHLRKSSLLNVPAENIDEKDFESLAQDNC